MSRACVLVAALLVASGTRRARAQGFDGERFVPAAGAAGGLVIERPVVPAHLGHGVGLFLNFADDAVVARDRETRATAAVPLDQALSLDLLASLGLFDFAELGVHLPLRLIYRGDSLDLDGGAIAAAAGVGDLRLVPKVTFGWNGDTQSGSAFGLAVPVSLPTGQPGALRGAGGPTVEPRLLALSGGAGRSRGGAGPDLSRRCPAMDGVFLR